MLGKVPIDVANLFIGVHVLPEHQRDAEKALTG
jgi:hypothetical protein